ncbi:hypothetical protein Bca52824_075012 [Brassica carinata]|uniref:Uncharacterized protein n=1 Tax=Brassica carinata TaxID=52824 RepID=A0A8X7PR94_BRACI|nr:hypothetical protein Bca52824_075012 [Brassica carinata]
MLIVTEQVRLLAKDEDENPTEPSAYDVIRPYDQAKALGKSNIDVGRIAAGLPCGSEGLLLMCPVAKTRKGTLQRKKRFFMALIVGIKCYVLNIVQRFVNASMGSIHNKSPKIGSKVRSSTLHSSSHKVMMFKTTYSNETRTIQRIMANMRLERGPTVCISVFYGIATLLSEILVVSMEYSFFYGGFNVNTKQSCYRPT